LSTSTSEIVASNAVKVSKKTADVRVDQLGRQNDRHVKLIASSSHYHRRTLSQNTGDIARQRYETAKGSFSLDALRRFRRNLPQDTATQRNATHPV